MVIMFTGYLVGFAMFKALFNNSAVLVSSLGPFLVGESCTLNGKGQIVLPSSVSANFVCHILVRLNLTELTLSCFFRMLLEVS